MCYGRSIETALAAGAALVIVEKSISCTYWSTGVGRHCQALVYAAGHVTWRRTIRVTS